MHVAALTGGPLVPTLLFPAGAGASHNITVPVNTRAVVSLPAKDLDDVTEGGVPVAEAEGVHRVEFDASAGRVHVHVGSGTYTFSAHA